MWILSYRKINIIYLYTKAVSSKKGGPSQREKRQMKKKATTTHPAAHYHTSSPKCKDSTYWIRDTRAG